MKKIMVLICFMLAVLSRPVLADDDGRFFHRLRVPDTLVGRITGVSRDMLEVFDEDEKTTKQLVYVLNRGQFAVGDRVKIFFNTATGAIDVIKKMTPVEYRRDQNAGYLFKKE